MIARMWMCAVPLALLAADAPNRLSPDEVRHGWELLFDGSSAEGWTEVTGRPFPSTCWTIEDGCLKAFRSASGVQDIRTRTTYRDFEFSFEWKIERGGNSGVKYLIQQTSEWKTRGTDALQARARGFEYQLTDDANSPETARDATRGTASLYSVLAPRAGAVRPAGEFNASRIILRGQHVEHWLNGAKVLEYELPDAQPAALSRSLLRGAAREFTRESAISLQNHNSEVWFRSLKIRRLR